MATGSKAGPVDLATGNPEGTVDAEPTVVNPRGHSIVRLVSPGMAAGTVVFHTATSDGEPVDITSAGVQVAHDEVMHLLNSAAKHGQILEVETI